MALTDMEVDNQGAIEAQSVTCAHSGLVEADVNKPVKLSGANTAVLCAADDPIFGVLRKVEKDICTVQVGGMAAVEHSGAAPALGWTPIQADGSGKIKAGTGTGPSKEKRVFAVKDSIVHFLL